jgi:tRNA nucleotidyltransferase/poly(A) polymerase
MQRQLINKIATAFNAHNKSFYLVGGTVRDALLNRESKDTDATTDARPDEIKAVLAETMPLHIIPIGEKFGTIQAIYDDNEVIEATTYRGERYNPG